MADFASPVQRVSARSRVLSLSPVLLYYAALFNTFSRNSIESVARAWGWVSELGL